MYKAWLKRKWFRKNTMNFRYELGYNEHGGISGKIYAYLQFCNDGTTLRVVGSWYHFSSTTHQGAGLPCKKEIRRFDIQRNSLRAINKQLGEIIAEFNEFAQANGTTPYAEPAMFETTHGDVIYSNKTFERNYPWRDDAHTH